MGILSIACTPLEGPAPRSPGSGGDDAPLVHVDTSPFSVEEHERIAAVDPWVTQAATKHGIDPDLLRGMIWVESRYVTRAKSPAGARGLMQLMPATANGLAQKMGKRSNPYDPEFNIAAGSLYLHDMIARYDGDVSLGLAAYNAGPGNVDEWRAAGAPPRNAEYVQLVLNAKARFEAAYHVPQGRPTDTQLARAGAPDKRPAIVVPEPPARVTEDGTPVRFDLDRVESEYQPVVEDPPMGETPAPTKRTAPRAEPKDDVESPATEPDVEVGVGVLPSVTP